MNKRGQSIIEYALIAVLVILGIVFMGPYVLRSINAHFQLWDEGVQDSFDETINQAPLNDIPNITVNCSCQDVPGGCGSNAAGSQCGPNQQIENHLCNPVGCDGAPASSCVIDNGCCTQPSAEGCGTYPCPSTGPTPGCNQGASTAPLPSSNPTNCYYGYQIESTTCGSNNNISCAQTSLKACQPQCLGIVTSNATACPNSPGTSGQPPYPNMYQNYGITMVQYKTLPNNAPPGSTYCNGAPCQYYCASNYQLINGVCVENCDTHTFTAQSGNHYQCYNVCCGGDGNSAPPEGDNDWCPYDPNDTSGPGQPSSWNVEALMICKSYKYQYVTGCTVHCIGANGVNMDYWKMSPSYNPSVLPLNLQQPLQFGTTTYSLSPSFSSGGGWKHSAILNTVTCSNCQPAQPFQGCVTNGLNPANSC